MRSRSIPASPGLPGNVPLIDSKRRTRYEPERHYAADNQKIQSPYFLHRPQRFSLLLTPHPPQQEAVLSVFSHLTSFVPTSVIYLHLPFRYHKKQSPDGSPSWLSIQYYYPQKLSLFYHFFRNIQVFFIYTYGLKVVFSCNHAVDFQKLPLPRPSQQSLPDT